MPDIYLLKCKGGKYYVGKANNDLEKRINKHMRGKGCAWTKKYPAIKRISVFNNADKFDEDKYTLKFMEKYGIENVRGGTYSNPELEEYQISEIQEKIDGANDRCLRCGRSGHFMVGCYAKTHANGRLFDDEHLAVWNDDELNEKGYGFEGDIGVCFRCGREDHYAYDCYAKRDVFGRELEDNGIRNFSTSN